MNERQPSVLRTLRDLVPARPLAPWETRQRAELQANRLRELLGLQNQPFFPTEAITEFPRVRVTGRYGMAVSGATAWSGRLWLIDINAAEPAGRQRFSLAHEFKHIIDHTAKDWLYGLTSSADEFAERAADYFAGCLLMPKRHVKSLFYAGNDRRALARLFGVTPRAIEVRLSQLGLLEAIPRCGLARPRPQSRQRKLPRQGVAA